MKKLAAFIPVILMLSFGCEEEQSACPECSLSPDPGICFAAIPKYYFDPLDQACKEFTWGGCGGVVPFESMAECEACNCVDD